MVYIMPNGRPIVTVKWKRCGRKQLQSILRYDPSICLNAMTGQSFNQNSNWGPLKKKKKSRGTYHHMSYGVYIYIKKYFIMMCRVHAIFCLRLPFTYAVFLDMCILPFSYPHPFLTPSLPWVALLNSRPLPCRTSSGKHSLEIWFSFLFLNSVWDPGGVSCHCGLPTWRPFGQP
jgi:hypothetical protein